MNSSTIASLKPNVSRNEAVRVLAGGATGWSRRLALGPLRSVADVYVPFRIYRIQITDGARRESDLIGLDAVSGALDLYRFERPPQDDELVRVQTPNHLAPLLADNEAREIVTTKVERLTFQRTGFFAVRELRVAVEPIAESQIPYWPYWVGFFGSGEAARVVAMDAVRRTIEGAKVVRLFRRWLTGADCE